jgi:hypothetical protein
MGLRRSDLWLLRRNGVALSDAREKIGATAWIPVAERKRCASVNGGQGLTVDQDRIVDRARLATRRNGHSRRAAS